MQKVYAKLINKSAEFSLIAGDTPGARWHFLASLISISVGQWCPKPIQKSAFTGKRIAPPKLSCLISWRRSVMEKVALWSNRWPSGLARKSTFWAYRCQIQCDLGQQTKTRDRLSTHFIHLAKIQTCPAQVKCIRPGWTGNNLSIAHSWHSWPLLVFSVQVKSIHLFFAAEYTFPVGGPRSWRKTPEKVDFTMPLFEKKLCYAGQCTGTHINCMNIFRCPPCCLLSLSLSAERREETRTPTPTDDHGRTSK